MSCCHIINIHTSIFTYAISYTFHVIVWCESDMIHTPNPHIYADTHIYMYTHIYVCICSCINRGKFILLRSLYYIYIQTCLIQSWHVISSFILVYAYAHTQSHRPSKWWHMISSVTDDILICSVTDGILCHILCYRK